MKNLLQLLYQTHHETGSRLRQSLLENIRGDIFKKWIGENKKVLDLGCRDGQLTKHFVQNNLVTGCDIDNNALKFAKKKYGIKTRQIDLNLKLPFTDNSYDIIVMGEVLEHLPYWDITLSEVQRILRKNGYLIGSIPLAYHLKDRWNVLRGKKLIAAADPTHLHLLSYDDFILKISKYFAVNEISIIQGGGNWRSKFPRLFARNICFKVRKK
jgi:SAM-dependent methyltransferase